MNQRHSKITVSLEHKPAFNPDGIYDNYPVYWHCAFCKKYEAIQMMYGFKITGYYDMITNINVNAIYTRYICKRCSFENDVCVAKKKMVGLYNIMWVL